MSWIEISSPVILQVSGRDATRYLNARLTNDIRTLPECGGCRAIALTPQGAIQALFVVLRISGNEPQERTYLLLCDGGARSDVIAALKRFMVADRVDVVDRSDDFRVIHLTSSALPQSLLELSPQTPYSFKALPEGGYLLNNHRLIESGYDLIIPKGSGAESHYIPSVPSLTKDEYLIERVVASRPIFPDELGADLLAAEAPLRDAISFTKGCYAGQEVVEKIDSHGKAPRILAGVEFSGALTVAGGIALSSKEGKEIGEVISGAYDQKQDRTVVFAILKNRGDFTSPFLTTIPGKLIQR